MKGDRTLMAVNGIGAALQSLYIAVYCYYSPAKVGGYGAGLWGGGLQDGVLWGWELWGVGWGAGRL